MIEGLSYLHEFYGGNCRSASSNTLIWNSTIDYIIYQKIW